jgi:hypothetical protein
LASNAAIDTYGGIDAIGLEIACCLVNWGGLLANIFIDAELSAEVTEDEVA